MNIRGRVKDGVVVLDEGAVLPDGAMVTVLYSDTPRSTPDDRQPRIALPLVPSARPGSVTLTAERVAELLDEADVSA